MARDFNGAGGSNVNFGDVNGAAMDGVNPMTIVAWIRPDSIAAGVNAIVAQDDTGGLTRGYYFARTGDEVHIVARGNTPVSSVNINLVSGEWVLVAVRAVTNGANSDCKYVKYSTSKAKTTSTVSDNFTSYASANRVYLATSNGGSNNMFNGAIGRVAVFVGDELSDEEVWAFGMFGPSAVGRNPDFYAEVLGVSPEPEWSGSGRSGTVGGTCPYDTPLYPGGNFYPVACGSGGVC